VVQAALGRPGATVEGWQVAPLRGLGFGAAIHRISGVASHGGVRVGWSVIRKHVRDAGDAAADFSYWRREPLAYASGLLARLTGVAAPRCFAQGENADGVVLWLEDVDGGGGWTVERYGLWPTPWASSAARASCGSAQITRVCTIASQPEPHPTAAPNGGSARVLSESICHSARCHAAGETCYQSVEPVPGNQHRAQQLDLVLLVVGAKLGAIGGRHRATLSLLHCSIQAVQQESSDTQPHWPTPGISFASRGSGVQIPSAPPRFRTSVRISSDYAVSAVSP
jgi:hypothetical protein